MVGGAMLVALMLGQSAGCSRNARLATGAVITTLGIALVVDIESRDPSDLERGLGYFLTLPILLPGVGLLIAGLATNNGPQQEDEPAVQVDPYALTGGNVGGHPTPQQQALAVKIQVAAREGRCPATYLMMQRLGELNAEMQQWLFDSDHYVAQCVVLMRAQGPQPAEAP
jgi:hypothetical protein